MGIEKAVANAKRSTVAVISRTFDLKTGDHRKPVVGSGVVMGEGLVVTCAHVLRYEPAEVSWKGYEVMSDADFDPKREPQPTWPAHFVSADETCDLAVLRVAGLKAPPVVLRDPCDCSAGTSVFWVGHPHGEVSPIVGAGIIASLQPVPTFPGGSKSPVAGFRLDTTTFRGNSGGGLFDENGRLVGINNAGPWLVRPDLLPALKAVHDGGAGVVGGVDVVGVLRSILEDMAGKSLSGIAFAIHGDVVREVVAKRLVDADPAL
jgi:S1-C subfamily serine protease